MPFITIKVLEGKTLEQKRQLVEKMTNVVSETFEINKENVFIFFEDLKKEDFGKHGKLYIDL